jgi:hypothetical protein
MAQGATRKGLSQVNHPPGDTSFAEELVSVLGLQDGHTCLVAGLLSILGLEVVLEDLVPAPRPAVMQSTAPASLVGINQRLLATAGGTWDDPPFDLPLRLNPRAEVLFDEAEGALRTNFAGSTRKLWLSPLLSLTCSWWQALLPNMRYIICVRHPLDVAAMLAEHGIGKDRALRLWWRYTTSALVGTSGRGRLVILYETLLRDPEGQAERLSRFLRLPLGRPPGEINRAVMDLSRAGLHDPSGEDHRAGEEGLSGPAMSLYASLLAQDRLQRLNVDWTDGVTDSLARFFHSQGAAAEDQIAYGFPTGWDPESLRESLGQIGRLQIRLAEMTEENKSARAEIDSLSERLRDSERRAEQASRDLAPLQTELEATRAELDDIRSRPGFQAVDGASKLLSRLTPWHTRRGRAVALSARGLAYLINAGPAAFVRRLVRPRLWLRTREKSETKDVGPP